jgi:hypothetical protein
VRSIAQHGWAHNRADHKILPAENTQVCVTSLSGLAAADLGQQQNCQRDLSEHHCPALGDKLPCLALGRTTSTSLRKHQPNRHSQNDSGYK